MFLIQKISHAPVETRNVALQLRHVTKVGVTVDFLVHELLSRSDDCQPETQNLQMPL